MAKLSGKYALAERGDRATNFIINAILVIAGVSVIYPLWFVVIASFSDPDAIAEGKVILWPVQFTLAGYKEMIKNELIWTGYRNTLAYAVFGTAWSLLKMVPLAFALSRRDLPGRRWINLFFIFPMYFSGGMVPSYVLNTNLGFYNNPLVMIIPGGVAAYNLVLTRTFFMSNINDSLVESARIDGASYTNIFLRIILPLSGSIIAIMVLWSVQSYWGTYLTGVMYLPDTKYWTLQQAIRQITASILEFNVSGGGGNDALTDEELAKLEELERQSRLLKYSVVILGAMPMIVLYPFIQKHFVKGIMLGSVKG